MKVVLAKTAGFCMGVKRAMEMVLAESNRTRAQLFTYGPLIHNRQVVDMLTSRGIQELDNIDDFHTGEIVIRAHGIPPDERAAIKAKGFKILDATCPRVARVQALIRYHTSKGCTAVIVGDKDHAEVKGLIGYSKGHAYIIQEVEDIAKLPDTEPIVMVAQTTQDGKKFRDIETALKKRFPEALTFNTICDATNQRQHEVAGFKGKAEAIVVVGGKHSGNTQRLFEVAKESGLPTFYVETDKDINEEDFKGITTVGVTAGASTPTWMIKKVTRRLEEIHENKTSPVYWLKRILRFLVLSDLAVAGGAFCLACAAGILAGEKLRLIFPLLSTLYIYAMHVLNRFLDKEASIYNDPERAIFLEKYKDILIPAGCISFLSSILISWTMGWPCFIAIIILSGFGIICTIPLVPKSMRAKLIYSRLKDIPGSRSMLEALTWGIAIGILPILSCEYSASPAAILSLAIVFLISYARALFMDLLQTQGDLVVGTNTLPIIIGEKKAITLIYTILCTTVSSIAAGIVTGIMRPSVFLFILPVITMGICFMAHHKSWLRPGTLSEALVEANFFFIGILALCYSLF